MEEQEFWGLIEQSDAATKGECMEQVGWLTRQLALLPAQEIEDYQRHFDEMRRRANRYDIHGAAAIINGGCSDDCFDDFRAWLIGRGQQVFKQALLDPDSLATVEINTEQPDVECQHLLYAGLYAYEEVTGNQLEDRGHPPFEDAPEDEWVNEDDDDLMKARYPSLWAKFIGDL